jgi:predicted small lipoprotein YifL
MRRSCLGIAGALLAFSLAGCGESAEEGPVGYKGTDSPAIQDQLKVMTENAKNKSITTKGAEDKSAAKKEKADDKKPAADAATDKKN